VDPLATIIPTLSPYSYVRNNPTNYIDPYGLFETKKEAKEYRKEHGINGKIQRNKDGSFSIDDRKNGVSYRRIRDGEERSNTTGADGVEQSALAVGEKRALPGYINRAYNNAIASGEYGRYSPPRNDGFSVSVNGSVNGFFFHTSFSLQIGVSGEGLSVLYGGEAGLGLNVPGIDYGFQAALHNNYGGNVSVLDGLRGVDIVNNVAMFSYSTSARTDNNNNPILIDGMPQRAASGVDSYGINFGKNLKPDMSFGKSVSRSYQMFKIKNPL
jgi:hypothetical protein